MIADNGWYGHRRVLSDYCGLARERPIFGSVVHGWYENVDPGVGLRRMTMAPVFFWNSRHLAQAAAQGVPNCTSFGAPFIYAVRNLLLDDSLLGAGTLVFHAHSAESVQIEHDLDSLAEAVTGVAEPPYTMSVYYQDRGRGIEDWCYRNDWSVVTFGTRGDPLFAYRLATTLSHHATVVTSGPQSALWYAAFLRRNVRMMGGLDELRLDDRISSARLEVYEMYMNGLKGGDAKRLADPELGAEFFQEPAQLAATLGWSSLWRRVGASVFASASDARFGSRGRQGDMSESAVARLRAQRERYGGFVALPDDNEAP